MNFWICSGRVSWNDIDRIHNPPWSPAVTRSPWSSPTVPRRPLQPPTLKCLTLQGPPSSTMTAVLRFLGRGWTAFCLPVRSRALGSPPAGPYGAPGPLRTLVKGKNCRCLTLHITLGGFFQPPEPIRATACDISVFIWWRNLKFIH